MTTYYGIYSLLVALWVLWDAPQHKLRRWWALGMPFLFPYYVIKTRPSKTYWKHIGLWLLGFFVLHALGTTVLKLETLTASDKASNQTTWNKFVSPDNRFSVLFPTPPNRESDIVNTPHGKAELVQYMSKSGDILYAVMHGDYPAKGLVGKTTEELLNNARDGAKENVQGKILCETIIFKGGYSGREITMKVQPNLVLTAQVFLKGNRIYQVMVVAPSEKLFVSHRRQFFESFEILE